MAAFRGDLDRLGAGGVGQRVVCAFAVSHGIIQRFDELGLGRELLQVRAGVRILFELGLGAPQKVVVRQVPDLLAEGAHFLLRAGAQVVELFRHLLGGSQNTIEIVSIGGAKPRRQRIRSRVGLRR